MYITQGLKEAAQNNGDGVATIDGHRIHTWSQLTDRVARLAGALHSMGLQPNDRVAMLALNSDRYLEYFFATIWAGGIFVPINHRLAPREVADVLTNAEAKILVVDDALQPQLASILEHTSVPQHLVFSGDGKPFPDLLNHEVLIANNDPAPDAGHGGDDIATLIYTGGTTGKPKGVMLTHKNSVSNALSVLEIMGDGKPITYLHTAPMFHIADSQWNTTTTIVAGTHTFAKKFVPEEMLARISEHQITHIALVPTMINMLCHVPDAKSYDVSSLRKINFGGSAISPDVIKEARDLFPNCEFIQGYGQTETSPNISMLLDKYNTYHGPFSGKIQSAGQPMSSMEVRIVDADDNEVPRGTTGEITARGPHVMAGYWNMPEETERALRGGWMHTGDIGYIDEDGFIFVVDRLKDMIITGGENVYSTEVENAIYKLPGIKFCAVIGIPHEKWGEAVHAIITPKDGYTLTAEEIIEHCHEYIAGYKCPKTVEIRTEPMPMSGAGKILKKVLRAPYWDE